MASPTPAPDRKQQIARLFDMVASTYEAVGVPWFGPIAADLVEQLAPQAGERAVDLGCGTGLVTIPLATAVGPSGHVTALDLAPAMAGETRAAVARQGLANVDVSVMDVSLPAAAGDGFDIAASSLVLFFLPDPGATLRAWHDLLAPRGRLGISTFGRRDEAWGALDDVFRPYLPPHLLDARTSGMGGPFGSDDGVAQLVSSAGFTDVRTRSMDVQARFADVEQWRAWSWSHGQRVMWLSVPADRRADVLAAAARELAGCPHSDGQIVLTQRVRYTLARRAD